MDLQSLLNLGLSVPLPQESALDTTGLDINLSFRIKHLKGHED